jgi:DNA-binding transcriptional ArsR family regulator
MTTKVHRNDQTEVDCHLPTEVAFDLLAHRRRRQTLRYLSERVGAVPAAELASHLAQFDARRSANHTERVLVSLRHNHLPRLESAGVVTLGDRRETVMLTETAAELTRYLDVAPSRR